MSYAIIGAGNAGKALAKAFARQSIEVALASRRPRAELAPIAKAIGPTIIPKPLQDAVKAEVVLLAIPFNTYHDVAKAAESWQGKTVIDVTNAYGVPPEELGNRPSSAVIADALPGAGLVKAFNHLPAEVLAEDPNVWGRPACSVPLERRRKGYRQSSGVGERTRVRAGRAREACRGRSPRPGAGEKLGSADLSRCFQKG
jgi:predicted dinucleotide-binding enzyme